MTLAMAYALPAMQLVCNLIVPQTATYNITTGPITGLVNVTRSPDPSPGVPQQPANQLKPIILPDGYIRHPEIGIAYKVSTDKVTWKLAKERCVDEGAHLAVIDNFMKFEYLMSQTTEREIHVGIIRMYDGAEWVSATTGFTIAVPPWASGEPSGDNDCVRTDRDPRGLRNFKCNHQRNYACEIPISESYNTQENEAAN